MVRFWRVTSDDKDYYVNAASVANADDVKRYFEDVFPYLTANDVTEVSEDVYKSNNKWAR